MVDLLSEVKEDDYNVKTRHEIPLEKGASDIKAVMRKLSEFCKPKTNAEAISM